MRHLHPADAVTLAALAFVFLLFLWAVYEVVAEEARKRTQASPLPQQTQEDFTMALSATDNEIIGDIQSLITAKNNQIAGLQKAVADVTQRLSDTQQALADTQSQLASKTDQHDELLAKVQALIGPELPQTIAAVEAAPAADAASGDTAPDAPVAEA